MPDTNPAKISICENSLANKLLAERNESATYVEQHRFWRVMLRLQLHITITTFYHG
jgi:hypothetical protein